MDVCAGNRKHAHTCDKKCAAAERRPIFCLRSLFMPATCYIVCSMRSQNKRGNIPLFRVKIREWRAIVRVRCEINVAVSDSCMEVRTLITVDPFKNVVCSYSFGCGKFKSRWKFGCVCDVWGVWLNVDRLIKSGSRLLWIIHVWFIFSYGKGVLKSREELLSMLWNENCG